MENQTVALNLLSLAEFQSSQQGFCNKHMTRHTGEGTMRDAHVHAHTQWDKAENSVAEIPIRKM